MTKTTMLFSPRRMSIYCSVCKRQVEVPLGSGEGEKEAIGKFRKSGHTEEPVAETAPDVGRRSRRYERAVARRQDSAIHKARQEQLAREKEAANV